MKFGIYSRYMVDDIVPTSKKAILIRIFSDNNDYFDMKYIDLYSKVLELYIKDFCDKKDDGLKKLIDTFIELNNFILSNDFDEVIIHCTLGISRSPAIMICIAKILGCFEIENKVKKKFKCYNKIIVDEFENFDYLRKDISIDDVMFQGYKGDNNYCNLDIIDNNNDTYSLVLKR